MTRLAARASGLKSAAVPTDQQECASEYSVKNPGAVAAECIDEEFCPRMFEEPVPVAGRRDDHEDAGGQCEDGHGFGTHFFMASDSRPPMPGQATHTPQTAAVPVSAP